MSNYSSDNKIDSEELYQLTKKRLNQKKESSKILCFLMQLFENYRQSKKIGWSRSWNKDNTINFQSFRLNADDKELGQLAQQLMSEECPKIPESANQFISELLNNQSVLLGFIFIQEFTQEDNRKFEGVTLSYGRIYNDNRRYRDRFDLILESEIIEGRSQGFSRIRIFIDPYQGIKPALWTAEIAPSGSASRQLFQRLSQISWHWAEDQRRIWDHWTSQYIDYFGERQEGVLEKSYFYVADHPEVRIIDNQDSIA